MGEGKNILRKCRSYLYSLYPYLDGACAGIVLREAQNGETETIATDGDAFFYNAAYIERIYRTSPDWLIRGYLHMMLHCMYGHTCELVEYASPFESMVDTEGKWCPAGEEGHLCFFVEELHEHLCFSVEELHDLACDLAVEIIIEEECLKNYKAGQLFGLKPDPERRKIIRELQRRTGQKTPSAGKIELTLKRLMKAGNDLNADVMRSTWPRFDDHHLWYQQTEEVRKQLRDKWILIQRFAERGTGGHGGLGSGGSMGTRAGGDTEKVGRPDRSRTDYRAFLRQFTEAGEAMELDPENYDYIYYTLGMELYGDIPLIEPLEYREGHRLRQLAIAIDTSGSCSAETVRRFLSETYAILGESENFFSRMEVLVIQCDAWVQEAVVIRSREEWYRYVDDLTIKGRGGTDFRPVFSYIDSLQRKGKMRQLKALIYFTDGDGVYPTMKPESISGYETAFVSLEGSRQPGFTPRWVKRLYLDNTAEWNM